MDLARTRRTLLGSTILASGLIMGPLASLVAQAHITICRDDPVFSLSNGSTITLYETISADPSTVTRVHYDVHGPVGTNLVSVDASGDTPASQQTWAYYADEEPGRYDTFTMVTTSPLKEGVTAYLVAAKAKSQSQSGFSGKEQHMHLDNYTAQGSAPGTIMVTADDQTMTYGGQAPQYTASYSGFKPGDSASVMSGSPQCSSSTSEKSAAGTYMDAINCTQNTLTAVNYTFGFQPGTLTIAPAPLTISAGSATVTYGAPVPTIPVSYHGFVNGDDPTSLDTAPTCTSPAVVGSPVGTYRIACSGAAGKNYVISYLDGQFTVAPAGAFVTLPHSDAGPFKADASSGMAQVQVSATIGASAGDITTALPVTYKLVTGSTSFTCTDFTGSGMQSGNLRSSCSFSGVPRGGYTLTVSAGGNYTGNRSIGLKIR